MASNEQKMISLKLLIDKKQNRVIFAEAKRNFVDILFSFLTLPMGNVIRLLRKQSEQLVLGCMNNLYKSVEDLEDEHFEEEVYKTMLLRPRNSSADECKKLKVNIDDTEETLKYYVCSNMSSSHGPEGGFSNFPHSLCSCGSTISKEMPKPLDSSDAAKAGKVNEVFLKGSASFIITDDLQVVPLLTETTFGLLDSLGVRATEELEKKNITIGLDEVSLLFKHALFSHASLTDAFLVQPRDVPRRPKFEFTSAGELDISENDKKISLKVIYRKSNNVIVYAEAEGNFVSFLFSLLTFPLGSVVKLVNQPPSLGCITNLHKSVEGLNADKYMKSEDRKAFLLSPNLALQYSCKHQLLGVTEATHPSYFYNQDGDEVSVTTNATYLYRPYAYSKKIDLVRIAHGFVSGPTVFMITDDLVVSPLSSISTLTLLEQLNIPIHDIEKRVVSVGTKEALRILEAAMASNTVLSNVLKDNITTKKPKEEKS